MFFLDSVTVHVLLHQRAVGVVSRALHCLGASGKAQEHLTVFT